MRPMRIPGCTLKVLYVATVASLRRMCRTGSENREVEVLNYGEEAKSHYRVSSNTRMVKRTFVPYWTTVRAYVVPIFRICSDVASACVRGATIS
jgi:hypothetical protein